MKISKVLFLILLCGTRTSVFADSFLKAQSFPEPFKNISFGDKIEFETKDYAQFAPEYDDKGVCIKNCAFPGLNAKDKYESIEAGLLIDPEESEGYDDGEDVTLDMEFDENGNCISGCDGENISYDKFNEEMNKRSEQAYKESLEYQERQKTNPDQTGYDYNCAGRNTEIPVGQKIPYSEPLKGKPRITDWFGSLRSFRRNKKT
ncbi:MAG: hypothetical protein IKN73_04380, partial [Alphaproteobacteria bacterium]|nr:hypothetical protein [Alphaproteobacteria bacterium]